LLRPGANRIGGVAWKRWRYGNDARLAVELTAPRRLPRWFRWPGWRHLPRETRDTLFLIGVIGWTVIPHVAHLPLWCSALTAAVLIWRALLAVRQAALPGRWVVLLVLGAAIVLTLWSYQTLLGKAPGITMAVTLMALKTLELRARRDAFVVFFLGFFLVLTHFLYSQSLLVAAAMLVSVWGLLTALVLAHMPAGQPSLRQAGLLSARTALLGAPIMLLLFVLFPRIGPLWGVPHDGTSSTGLSLRMSMGSVAEVALDDSIALRVRFDGAAPRPQDMYFRGPVLGRFDGTEWRPLPATFATPGLTPRRAPGEVRPLGPEVRYEMTLEPLRLSLLPLLEATPRAPQVEGIQVLVQDDLQAVTDRPILQRLRFHAEAHTAYAHGPQRFNSSLFDSLALPAGFNPRTLAWARALRAESRYANADAGTLARALLQHIRSAGFSYTLAPGEYPGPDTIDQFWLDRRAGFCEHFAAAFVVLMRALDIPARVVTGYQGTDPMPVDGYYIVRQSSAHAWAEYWQEGSGWQRADPTAAVAPERIERSRNLLPAPSLMAGALSSLSPELLARLREGWETMNNRWNQWVLGYSRGAQFDLLRNLGMQTPGWEDLVLLLVASLSGLAAFAALWAWRDRNVVDPWTRQMEKVRAALRSAGLPCAAHEAPRALALRVQVRFGDTAQGLIALLLAIEAQRYSREARSRPHDALTRQFVAQARNMAQAAMSATR
jgi:protein-glutamine gamma-glutamyltransferase